MAKKREYFPDGAPVLHKWEVSTILTIVALIMLLSAWSN